MIITTTQEYERFAGPCCPCDLPICENPRKDCQSITVFACGTNLPNLESVPAELRCILYKKVASRYFNTIAYTTVPWATGQETSGTIIQDFKCSKTYTFKVVGSNRVCRTTDFVNWSEITDLTTSYTTPPEEGSPIVETLDSTISGEGTEETWVGTYSFTYTYPASGEPSYSDTVSYGYPGCLEVTPTEDFTLAELVFSKTTVTILITTEAIPNPDEDPENPDDDTIEQELGRTTETTVETVTYSEPVVLEDLNTEIAEQITMYQEDDEADWPGSSCASTFTTVYGYPDPEPEPEPDPDAPPEPDPEPDPDAPPEPAPEPVCSQVNSATKVRYRMGIPASSHWDAVTEAWLAWDKEDPETRGDAPPKTTYDVAYAEWEELPEGDRGDEPLKRSYYVIQWDEAFFPEAWEDWKVLYDAYILAVEAHEAWEADTTIPKPPEPDVPDDPGEAPTPAPSLIASRSWTYAGTEDFSPWYELEVPTSAGESRVVNILFKCYRSTRFGVLPTSYGEIYEFPETP
jgi:hypothetical protein